MIDQYGRKIDYIRISVTDRCNLHCTYCTPQTERHYLEREKLLTFDEILKLAEIFRSLGIKKIKLTGGEPLVRADELGDLIFRLKQECGMETVTLTTNGVLLESWLMELTDAGLDGINISLDTLNRDKYCQITGSDRLEQVLNALKKAEQVPNLLVRINCVLMHQSREEILDVAKLTTHGTDVRFIELMPIGYGSEKNTLKEEEIKVLLSEKIGSLIPVIEKVGNGPAHYYRIREFGGKIGFISAMSHKFCSECNRVRLTADGYLKACLQYEAGINLRSLLRDGASEKVLREQIRQIILEKPKGHHFGEIQDEDRKEHRIMSQIGG